MLTSAASNIPYGGARHFLREIGRSFFFLPRNGRAGIGAFFGSGNIAERKKVVKRVKRDRHEKKGRWMKKIGTTGEGKGTWLREDIRSYLAPR